MNEFGIIYTTKNKIIISLWGSNLDWKEKNLTPGTSMLRLRVRDYPNLDYNIFQSLIGTPAHSGRCAVIENGKVVNIIKTDPDVFTPSSGQLIVSDVADLDWDWDGVDLTVRLAIIDSQNNVIDIIRTNDTTKISIPQNADVIQSDVAQIGWKKINGGLQPAVAVI